jgi:hypothetical protein
MVNRAMIQTLNNLSIKLNELYGYVNIVGDNFGEPAINSGPCAPVAKALYECWNSRFVHKVNIVFIMIKNSEECWHVLIRLPNGMLFDGGIGVHNEEKYQNKFDIEDMLKFDLEVLEKRSYGLDREYPRYCPNFSIDVVKQLIEQYLAKPYMFGR